MARALPPAGFRRAGGTPAGTPAGRRRPRALYLPLGRPARTPAARRPRRKSFASATRLAHPPANRPQRRGACAAWLGGEARGARGAPPPRLRRRRRRRRPLRGALAHRHTMQKQDRAPSGDARPAAARRSQKTFASDLSSALTPATALGRRRGGQRRRESGVAHALDPGARPERRVWLVGEWGPQLVTGGWPRRNGHSPRAAPATRLTSSSGMPDDASTCSVSTSRQVAQARPELASTKQPRTSAGAIFLRWLALSLGNAWAPTSARVDRRRRRSWRAVAPPPLRAARRGEHPFFESPRQGRSSSSPKRLPRARAAPLSPAAQPDLCPVDERVVLPGEKCQCSAGAKAFI
jgi:hypothetical protein